MSLELPSAPSPTPAGIPAYSALLSAYHSAYRAELQAMIADLPFCSGDRILDMGCGDGTFSRWISARVAPGGEVVGADLNEGYLTLARELSRQSERGAPLRFVRGDIARLPFPANSFDGVWCGQSFYSFPYPKAALAEMIRVVRPGGMVVVLENDSLHQVLLAWPVELELAIHQAEYRAFQSTSPEPQKFYIARRLRRLFMEAGLKPQPKRIYPIHREAPLAPSELAHLRLYLEDLRARIMPYLSPSMAGTAGRFLDPKRKEYLGKQSDLAVTFIDQIQWGKKPFNSGVRNRSRRKVV